MNFNKYYIFTLIFCLFVGFNNSLAMERKRPEPEENNKVKVEKKRPKLEPLIDESVTGGNFQGGGSFQFSKGHVEERQSSAQEQEFLCPPSSPVGSLPTFSPMGFFGMANNQSNNQSQLSEKDFFTEPCIASDCGKKTNLEEFYKELKFGLKPYTFDSFKNCLAFNIDDMEFKFVVEKFMNLAKEDLSDRSKFVKGKAFKEEIFKFDTESLLNKESLFFVQKVNIKKETKIFAHADIHGDLESLIAYMKNLSKRGVVDQYNPFNIVDKKSMLVFLGDYIDRGKKSREVLYFLMRLKIENPKNVLLMRGNHEGGLSSLKDIDTCLIPFINCIFNCLPVFACLQIDNFENKGLNGHIHIFHGGFEPRFELNALLSDERQEVFQVIDSLNMSWLKEKIRDNQELSNFFRVFEQGQAFEAYKNLKFSDINAEDIGFLWNDLDAKIGTFVNYNSRDFDGKCNILEIGEILANCIMKQYCNDRYEVVLVLRGHQHNDRAMFGDFLNGNSGLCSVHNSWLKRNREFDLSPRSTSNDSVEQKPSNGIDRWRDAAKNMPKDAKFDDLWNSFGDGKEDAPKEKAKKLVEENSIGFSADNSLFKEDSCKDENNKENYLGLPSSSGQNNLMLSEDASSSSSDDANYDKSSPVYTIGASPFEERTSNSSSDAHMEIDLSKKIAIKVNNVQVIKVKESLKMSNVEPKASGFLTAGSNNFYGSNNGLLLPFMSFPVEGGAQKSNQKLRPQGSQNLRHLTKKSKQKESKKSLSLDLN